MSEIRKIVLDTNCLIASLSRHSEYYPVWSEFQAGKYTLCVSNEILEEYQEIIEKLSEEDTLKKSCLKLDECESNLHLLEKREKLLKICAKLKAKTLNTSEIKEIEDIEKELDYGI